MKLAIKSKIKKQLLNYFEKRIIQGDYDLGQLNKIKHQYSLISEKGIKYVLCNFKDFISSPIEKDLEFVKISKTREIQLQEYMEFNDLPTFSKITGKVGVHVHLFYLDLLPEIWSYLQNIPSAFEVYVSVPSKAMKEEVEDFFIKNSFKSFFVKICPNRGRDIGPLLCGFSSEIKKCDYICHIHSKKSLSSEKFSKFYYWRQYLLTILLGSKDNVGRILQALENEKDLGVVFPESFYALGAKGKKELSVQWFEMFPSYQYLFDRLGINLLPEDAQFSAGTMFWAKTSALLPLLDYGFKYSDFPIEAGILNEGSLAHALERIICYLPLSRGYKNYILKSSVSSFFGNESLNSVYIETQKKIFDPVYYKDAYPDTAKYSPLNHFLVYGLKEARKPCKKFPLNLLEEQAKIRHLEIQKDNIVDDRFYYSTYFECAEGFYYNNIRASTHFKEVGEFLGFVPNDKLIKKGIEDIRSSKVKFSIVIPVFNSGKFLKRCLESVFSQTIENFEVIIVNDGSKDNSGQIIDEFKAKYSHKIKVIYHSSNLGLWHTHNDGISLVRGDYFTILDGDDWISPTFLEYLGAPLHAYEADCICCGWDRPSQYSSPKKETLLSNLRVLEAKNFSSISGSLFKWGSYPNIHYGLNRKVYKTASWRKIDPLKKVDKNILFWEDACVSSKFFTNCRKVLITDSIFYHWFYNPDSVGNCQLTSKYFEDTFAALSFISNIFQGEDREIYYRNVTNILLTETITRISTESEKELTRKFCKVFALFYEELRPTLPENLQSRISARILRLFLGASKDFQKEKSLFFLDPLGMDNLKQTFISFVKDRWKGPSFYFKCSLENTLLSKLNAIEECQRSLVCITSGGWSEDQFLTSTPIVQVWHGLGALKHVLPVPKELTPKLAFCSSEGVQAVYGKLFNLDPNKVLPYGAPIADFYLSQERQEKNKEIFFSNFPFLKCKKIYLWLPTFQFIDGAFYPPDTFDFIQIDNQLKEDEVLLVKWHPVIKKQDAIKFHDLNKVKDFTHVPLEQLLNVCDCASTDCSSSIFYAILLRKRVFFNISGVCKSSLLIQEDELPGITINKQNLAATEILNSFRNSKIDKKYEIFYLKNLSGCLGNSSDRIWSCIQNFLN